MKIIVEKEVPSAQITCPHCGSLIEYQNRDLMTKYFTNYTYNTALGNKLYYFSCPVCGVDVEASWIYKKEENG